MENLHVKSFLNSFSDAHSAQNVLQEIKQDVTGWAEKLKPYWLIIKPLLKFAELFTPDTIDYIIDEVIKLIDTELNTSR
jgi:hypothetical protein